MDFKVFSLALIIGTTSFAFAQEDYMEMTCGKNQVTSPKGGTWESCQLGYSCILEAKIIRESEYSGNGCLEGLTWGNEGHYLWVRNGCVAKFGLTIRRTPVGAPGWWGCLK